MTKDSDSNDKLAAEVAGWDSGLKLPMGDWHDAPEAVPRHRQSKSVTIRFPVEMLGVIKGFAVRQNIGYQVLIKQWLDDRIRRERDALRAAPNPEPAGHRHAPRVAGLMDQPAGDQSHYRTQVP